MSSLQGRLARWGRLLARIIRRPLLVNLEGLLRRVPFQPLQVNCLYLLEYSGTPPRRAALLRGPAEVRNATPEDLEGLTRCQSRRRAFLNRFEAGDCCAVAEVDRRIVAFQWFCVRPFYTEERYGYRIDVPADAIYEYDVFILPEFRLAGIWFKLHCLYLADLMARLHRKRIIGIVDYGNRLAMNTHLRFGFKLTRRVMVVRLLGKTFSWETVLAGDRDLPRWIQPGGADRAGARRPGMPPVPPDVARP